MKSGEEADHFGELNDLPNDSHFLKPYILKLRQKVEQEDALREHLHLSDNCLIRFLRARDFDVDLSLKVSNVTVFSKQRFIKIVSQFFMGW
uniref:CRAL/TRIO N-terminal domain-containing protein n=1 Tax=Anguilla anguilla TaxID=7936 RepID=A0A0E9Q846_ANGAN